MPKVKFVRDVDIRTSTTQFVHKEGDVVELDDKRARVYTDKGDCVMLEKGMVEQIADDLRSGNFVGLPPRDGKTLSQVGLPVPAKPDAKAKEADAPDEDKSAADKRPPVDAATTDSVLAAPVPAGGLPKPGGLPAPTGGARGGRRGS